MNWYKLAKHEFNYSKEQSTLWDALLNQEKKRLDIHFNLENNDNVSDPKRIQLNVKGGFRKDEEYAVISQMFSAGGDWENPITYFRCELALGKNRKYKFIFIPSRRQGNQHLKKREDTGWMAMQSNTTTWSKRDEKKLWNSLKIYAKKIAIKDKKNDIEYDDPAFKRNLAESLK